MECSDPRSIARCHGGPERTTTVPTVRNTEQTKSNGTTKNIDSNDRRSMWIGDR
ncbi:hypothetical protein PC117_g26244 [Phytophthora cactorum]|uniref:Uncharacterized protein n=1 Tax=Phytophthora cactorum TaxID=29920 RepID=A0A8T1AJC1_9STRA|nr:hypothetical protein PC117_g26244 [Phytophthora cactorum]KAG2976819.1 hypothetical protein PC120_g25631 [Phytophthora cactorum]